MTSPRHHLPDHVLLDYAAAALDPATRLIVSCHLTLCPACRDKATRFDNVGGAMLEALAEATLAPDGLAALLGKISAGQGGPEKVAAPPSAAAANPHALPKPLLSCLPGGEVNWRRWLPGVRGMTLNLGEEAAPARLVRFSPGVTVPLHDHERTEFVLVLDGHLHEGDEDYMRGDVAVSESGRVHTQRVDESSVCVALIVNQGPLIAKTRWGQVLKMLTGV